MKINLRLLALGCLMALGLGAYAKDYTYTTVPDDPMKTRIYKLDNGLTIYLSVNKLEPRIQANIAVRTGSRNDPPETTGLAHYLEHLMFKGTTHFGSSNVSAEAPLLDSIESRFEQYRHITDPQKRKLWYHAIDSISQLAAQYNIPNEYDKMMAAIGSQGSNAYTSNDITCYVENIPNNEVDNWARVQADRFQNMVIRGFHTELEAVYEEYNIGLANDGNKEWTALHKMLFPTHPYGMQTTIGTQQHLKNPSITNIKNYFHRYYVPNNVAICMSGDFDPDQVVAIIDKYFGTWKKSDNLSRPEYAPVADRVAPADTTVWGQEAENIIIGWKMAGSNSFDADTLRVISDILANGKAGLFDIDLNQPMKIQGAGAGYGGLHDYGCLIMEGMPNDGQSLEQVRDLILEEVGKLKKGQFSDELLPAVVNNMKLNYNKGLLDNSTRVGRMVDAFVNDEQWDNCVKSLDRIAGMTKQQIVNFANRYLNDGYVVIYKRQGNDTTIHKIDKPIITPIPTNNDKQSAFLKEIVNAKVTPIQPKFVDFKRDMTVGKTKRGLTVLYKQNPDDDLFKLTFHYPFGSMADNRYDVAADYLNYVGTDKMTNQQVNEAFYQLACDYSVEVSGSEMEISLSGLNSNMPKALQLLENLLSNAKADKDSYNNFVNLVLKDRADNKADQRSNFSHLFNYGRYGKWSPDLNQMSEQQLRSADPQSLLNLLRDLKGYDHEVLYFGATPLQTLSSLISKEHKTAKTLRPAPAFKPYRLQATPQNEVWLAPYKAQNIYLVMFHNENQKWAPENAPIEALFNEYFGGGMNAIVFQEMREARGLAYSASARYNRPYRPADNPESFYTLVISQNDKMADCIKEFNALLDSMPVRPQGVELAKQSLLKSLAAERTTRYSVLDAYLTAKRYGVDYDISQLIYNTLPKLQLKDVVDFATSHIAQKPYRYLILGDESQLDMKVLDKIAPVRRVSTEEIFGY